MTIEHNINGETEIWNPTGGREGTIVRMSGGSYRAHREAQSATDQVQAVPLPKQTLLDKLRNKLANLVKRDQISTTS